MNLLPIVERELRVASRQARTYWGRLTVGLTALVLSTMALFTGGALASTPQLGRQAFSTLSVVGLLVVVGTALRMTTDALSKEKREGTLGFLFLTELKVYDIVLGKLAATMLGSFYQFLAAVPALAMPILVGGVTVLDFARLVLALANIMFFAAAVGLLASALSRREARAAGTAALLMAGFLFAMPAAGLVWKELRGPSSVAEWLVNASPGYAWVQAIVPGYFAVSRFWTCIALTQAAGWGFLALTCWALPQGWQDRPAGAGKLRRRERWRDGWQGGVPERTTFRTGLLDINPIHWLTSRVQSARWHPWVFLAGVLVVLFFGAIYWHWPLLNAGLAFGVSYAINSVFKLWVGGQASRGFSTDRDQGALELLLSTPLNERDLVRGQWLTLRRLFGAPLAAWWVGQAIWMTMASWADEEMRGEAFARGALVMAASWLLLPADIVALSWVALWKGVTEPTATRAASNAQMRVLVLPWLATIGIGAILAIVAGPLVGPILFFLNILLCLAFSLAADLFFGRRARRQLLTGMRAAAARRFSGDPEILYGWIWLGRWAGRRVAGWRTPARSVTKPLLLLFGLAWSAPGASITFGCIGDYGSDYVTTRQVANLVKSWRPDFVITTGDNNYPAGAAITLDRNVGQFYHEFIHPYRGRYGRGAITNRFFPCLGNHDWLTDEARPYLEYFTLPGNERYYTFTRGPVQFFCLDSDKREPDGYKEGSRQRQWLEKEMTNSKAPWRIVFFHHAPYSSGYFHGSWTNESHHMRWPFREWGAHAVLTGHDHIYERVQTNGIVYLVNGLGGDSRDLLRYPLVPGSAKQFSADFGALRVEATESYLWFRFFTARGALIDQYRLAAPAPSRGRQAGPLPEGKSRGP